MCGQLGRLIRRLPYRLANLSCLLYMVTSCLLLDSGATKTEWVFLRKSERVAGGRLPGLHPFLTPATVWRESLQALHRATEGELVGEIFFYGTGCGSEQGCSQVKAYFNEFYRYGLQPFVDSDILAAARALCGDQPGMVAILGTGSNMALYNGREIVRQFGGFGYVLGDEGSGAALGRALLRAFLYEQLPAPIAAHLETQYGLSRSVIIDAVYKGGTPSRYLASWAAELRLWAEDPFIDSLIHQLFDDFVQSNVVPVATADFRVLHCTGSVALHFSPWLSAALGRARLQLGKIYQAPMAGLVDYHIAVNG